MRATRICNEYPQSLAIWYRELF